MDKTLTTVGIILGIVLIAIIGMVAVFGPGGFGTPSLPVTGTPSGNVTVFFFYGEECAHCHDVIPLVEALQEKYPDVEFRILETWHNPENYKLSLYLNKRLGLGQVGVPEAFVGDTVLVGAIEIPEKLEQAILDQKKTPIREIPQTAVLAEGPVVTRNTPAISAVYFYGDVCPHCEKVKPFLGEMEERYPDLALVRLEVYTNNENREKYLAMSQATGIRPPGVPVIFIGDRVLAGDVPITEGFEAAILAERDRISRPETPVTAVTPGVDALPATSGLTFPLVIGAALIDSTNPCGLAVLVFLLLTMAAAGSRKRILLAGGAYITAMFLFHLLVGIGLFSIIAASGLSKVFSVIGGVIALLFGLINLVDLLRNKETFFLSISENHKGFLGNYARRAPLPAAFILGILAGILGFTCTGGIYISILGVMGTGMSVSSGFGWLVLYNLIFVLPLILITLLASYGISPERADHLRTRHKRALRALIAFILIALGVIILLGWMG
jgi:cytochrome c biogenesis protein CcdA/thiol-disulfide isomerase/thioredoxin